MVVGGSGRGNIIANTINEIDFQHIVRVYCWVLWTMVVASSSSAAATEAKWKRHKQINIKSIGPQSTLSLAVSMLVLVDLGRLCPKNVTWEKDEAREQYEMNESIESGMKWHGSTVVG